MDQFTCSGTSCNLTCKSGHSGVENDFNFSFQLKLKYKLLQKNRILKVIFSQSPFLSDKLYKLLCLIYYLNKNNNYHSRWGRNVERNSDDDVWNQATNSGWGSTRSPKKLSVHELCIGRDWDGKNDKKYYFDASDSPTGESSNQNQEATSNRKNSRKFRGRPNWGSNQNQNPNPENHFYNNGNQQRFVNTLTLP